MTQEERDIRRKIKVLEHDCSSGNVSRTCRYFGISRETYYCWRRRYQQYEEKGLVNRRPSPRNPPWRTAPEIEKKVLHLRRTYHFGAQRIAWFLQRYHGVEISEGGARHSHPAWTSAAAEYRQQTHDHGQTGREAVSKASTRAPRTDRRQVSLLPWLN